MCTRCKSSLANHQTQNRQMDNCKHQSNTETTAAKTITEWQQRLAKSLTHADCFGLNQDLIIE